MPALAVPAIIINNISYPIKPNSFSYTEGKGEYKIRVASAGGSRTEKVFTRDIESAFSIVKVTFFSTTDLVAAAREWKINENTNVVQFIESGFDRTVDRAAIINDPEISMGVEGEFEITFHGDSAV